MKKTWINSLLLFLLAGGLLPAQESLSLLRQNGQLREAASGKEFRSIKKSGTQPDTLDLPFFDDFSGPGVFPDPRKWVDQGAYINSEMASRMVSIGVATLDVLDSTGSIYPYAQTGRFSSESLTSAPINLSAGSNIYLSFFYEGGGLVNAPEAGDSLVLEFRSPLAPEWEWVWSTPGALADSFSQAIIPVNDPRFLVKGFQFRFRNYASLSVVSGLPDMTGNQDLWHLDYIYLDKDRSAADTIYYDVAYVKPLRSLLLNYESIPWSHFPAAKLVEMGDKLGITYRNNGDVITNVTRFFEIRDLFNGSLVHAYTGGADNIDPFQVLVYNSNLIYSYASPAVDSAEFEVKSYLNTDVQDFKGNDTLTYLQRFYNYYAYDDGTAESGYLVNGEGTSDAMVAVKFRTYKTDTLRAVQMYFNQTFQNASQNDFSLAVWDDNDGVPGDLIYTQEDQLPQYEDELNGFHTYLLDEPIEVSGTFYTGWIQSSEVSINIGADINRDRSDRIFYFLPRNGYWANTSFDISLMMRPVLGAELPVTIPSLADLPGLVLYPNPARDEVFIRTDGINQSRVYRLSLFNSQGTRLWDRKELPERIDLSAYLPGLYFLRVEYANRQAGTYKLLIVK